MKLTYIKKLLRQGRRLYPNKHLRHQWVRKTIELESSGRHTKYTGGFPRSDYRFLVGV